MKPILASKRLTKPCGAFALRSICLLTFLPFLHALALPLNNGSFELRDVPAGSTSLSAERPESKFLSVISTFT